MGTSQRNGPGQRAAADVDAEADTDSRVEPEQISCSEIAPKGN
jgi:hypothetical protein